MARAARRPTARTAKPLARREQAAFRCGPICSGPERRYSRAGLGQDQLPNAPVWRPNERARHPAFGIRVGRSTHEKVGVDGGIGHLLLDVFFRFAGYGRDRVRVLAPAGHVRLSDPATTGSNRASGRDGRGEAGDTARVAKQQEMGTRARRASWSGPRSMTASSRDAVGRRWHRGDRAASRAGCLPRASTSREI
jgi:hypothetical protein